MVRSLADRSLQPRHLLRCAADPWARDGKNISVIDACRDQAVWKVMREELGIEDDWVEAPDASPAKLKDTIPYFTPNFSTK